MFFFFKCSSKKIAEAVDWCPAKAMYAGELTSRGGFASKSLWVFLFEMPLFEVEKQNLSSQVLKVFVFLMFWSMLSWYLITKMLYSTFWNPCCPRLEVSPDYPALISSLGWASLIEWKLMLNANKLTNRQRHFNRASTISYTTNGYQFFDVWSNF